MGIELAKISDTHAMSAVDVDNRVICLDYSYTVVTLERNRPSIALWPRTCDLSKYRS